MPATSDQDRLLLALRGRGVVKQAELAEQSDVITALATAFVNSLGDDHPANIAGRGRWLIRVITSLLIFPGHDEADERAMLTEFVAPVVVPAEQVSRAPG